jgi:hypothetical protein
VYLSKVGSNLLFRTLIAGTPNVTLTQNASDISISVIDNDSNSLTTLSNRGNGIGVWDPTTSNALKTLVGSANGIVITSNATNIIFDNTLSGSNLGTGTQVFSAKSGSNLQFNSLLGSPTTGVTVSSAVSGSITLTNTLTASNAGLGCNLFVSKTGSNLVFRTLTAGSNVTLAQTVDTISISANDTTLTLSNQGGGAQVYNESTPSTLRTLFGTNNGATVTQFPLCNVIDNTLLGSNIGTGTGLVYMGKTGSNLTFNSLLGQTTSGITVSSPVGGTVTLTNTLTGSNIGTGNGTIFAAKSGSNLQFNSLSGTINGLSISNPVSGLITVDNTLTGSNLGLSCNIFVNKTGSNLLFRTLIAGSNINIAQAANNLTVNVNGDATSKIIPIGTDQLNVNTTSSTSSSYYTVWDNAAYSIYTTRTIVLWVVPSSGARSLTLDVVNDGGATLGSIFIAAGSPTGFYSFTFSAPVGNTKLDFNAYRSGGAAPNPQIFGINMKLS